jgi:hypothetical protein
MIASYACIGSYLKQLLNHDRDPIGPGRRIQLDPLLLESSTLPLAITLSPVQYIGGR